MASVLPKREKLPGLSFVEKGAQINLSLDKTTSERFVLLDAKPGDLITFDPVIFPPDAPATIYVNSVLPPVSQGHITIDASHAGVILDGSNLPDGFNAGISIHSHGNTVRGMQVVGFAGAGIAIDFGQNNLIENNVSCGNDFGIGIWGVEAAANTIIGNYLGVLADDVTQRGNRTAGITIMEGANGNFIGPGNLIAYNGRAGIEIYHANTTGNLISQNSIHDNGERGIHLWDGGNHEITAPVIFDFDLSAGTVAGTTCDGCTVEIFSDSSDEGAIFEGQMGADSNGVFAFEKGTAFAGPYLTATAHDDHGDTSKFSTPTFGTGRKLILQEENNLPKAWLETKRSGELDDNRIGSVGMNDQADPEGRPHDLQATMERVVSMGLQQFRFTIVNIDGTLVDWTKPEFTFEQRQRDFISAMDENGVKVAYLLSFRDDVLGGEGRPLLPRFQTEEEIQRYLDYVRFIISNVKGHVTYYEIWNEPNIRDSVQWIEVEDYINLVRKVVPVIRQEDPEGKIMLAGTTYLIEPGAREYLFKVISSDIMPLVDVVAWHPMFGASPEFDSDYYYEYPSIIQQIKDTASAHGFRGEYHAGEISWWTEPEPLAQDADIWYSDVAAAKYVGRGIVMHLGMDVSVTINTTPSGFPSRRYADIAITNLCTIMAGAKATNLPVEIETEVTNLRSYSFSLPNGDYLVALWTDGVAVEDDPGIKATLTIPNFSAAEVLGIDVLFGFEQQLIVDAEGGNLVVRDLLVKDYPIFLRAENVSSP
jgi:parallel beta-helix repeat protein